ncbi:hypothetical protein RSAG8_05024, partial [Rhizoctonia solani AG-8 WAC10335]
MLDRLLGYYDQLLTRTIITTSLYTVQLFTQDEQTVTTDWEIFKQFGIFQPQTEDRPKEPVPLPNIQAATMNEVIEYCEQHRDDEPYSKNTPIRHTRVYDRIRRAG